MEVYGSQIEKFRPHSFLTLSLPFSSLLPCIPLQLFYLSVNRNVASDSHITFTSDRALARRGFEGN